MAQPTSSSAPDAENFLPTVDQLKATLASDQKPNFTWYQLLFQEKFHRIRSAPSWLYMDTSDRDTFIATIDARLETLYRVLREDMERRFNLTRAAELCNSLHL